MDPEKSILNYFKPCSYLGDAALLLLYSLPSVEQHLVHANMLKAALFYSAYCFRVEGVSLTCVWSKLKRFLWKCISKHMLLFSNVAMVILTFTEKVGSPMHVTDRKKVFKASLDKKSKGRFCT